MSDTTAPAVGRSHTHAHSHGHADRPNLDGGTHIAGILVFLAVLAFGLFWTINGLVGDMDATQAEPLAWGASSCSASRC